MVMTAPGRAPKRPTTIQRQRKLLDKYRKRIKKLQAKIKRQRYFLLLGQMERLEIAYHNRPCKALEEALRRLHRRMLKCGVTRRSTKRSEEGS